VRIIHPREYTAPWWMIGVVALSIPVKEWLAKFSRTLARSSGSQLIEAGYWHLRFESIMAGLVCFALISSQLGWIAVDGWIGLVIAALILHAGIELVRERIGPLIGEAPAAGEVQAIERAAHSLDGVRGVHSIIIHKYGDLHMASLHIEIDAQRPLLEAHELSEQVEETVERECGIKTVVHVDPIDRTHPAYSAVDAAVAACVSEVELARDYHDLRVNGKPAALDVSVDIVVDATVQETEFVAIARKLEGCLHGAHEGLKHTEIRVESCFNGSL
jgi:divalent metal cation (Fe/Co/Zn/Cd) transporter